MLPLSRAQIRQGFWVETRATVPCVVWPDGLLVAFRLADVESVLAQYPKGIGSESGEPVWFFNSSRDRVIAEQHGDEVVANPQLLLQHFIKESIQ